MFLAANLIEALVYVLRYILDFFSWAIIIRAALSWVSPDPFNPIIQLLHRVTDPILVPIQRKLWGYGWGIDFSPIIALLAIHFLKIFLLQSLADWANQIRFSIRGGSFY